MNEGIFFICYTANHGRTDMPLRSCTSSPPYMSVASALGTPASDVARTGMAHHEHFLFLF
jgi:hypothetical protein